MQVQQNKGKPGSPVSSPRRSASPVDDCYKAWQIGVFPQPVKRWGFVFQRLGGTAKAMLGYRTSLIGFFRSL
jgi:hypothetical protein